MAWTIKVRTIHVDSDAQTYSFYKDAVKEGDVPAPVAVSSPVDFTYTHPTDGQVSLHFTATDAVGNTSGQSNTVTVVLDRTAPNIGTLELISAVWAG